MNFRKQHCIRKDRQKTAASIFCIAILLCLSLYDIRVLETLVEYVSGVKPSVQSFAASQLNNTLPEEIEYCSHFKIECSQLGETTFLQKINESYYNIVCSSNVTFNNTTSYGDTLVFQPTPNRYQIVLL